jgi:hypothetical protein
MYEELWQFSHITPGFVGRVLIAGMLLAYGMIEDKLLIMIAGLLFLPLLPLMLAMSFGLKTIEWRLMAQGAAAFIVAIALLLGGGVLVALMMNPPILYNESNSMITGFLISIAVGVAAGLATTDDAGRRELIGLAATAQVAIIPVRLGILFVFGVSSSEEPFKHIVTFLMNVTTVIVAAMGTYAALGMKGEAVRRFAKVERIDKG